jgi:hypothetical protein
MALYLWEMWHGRSVRGKAKKTIFCHRHHLSIWKKKDKALS